MKREKRGRIPLVPFVIVVSLALLTAPVNGDATDFFGEDFESFTGIPREAASPLALQELDDLRGGFLGFFFSVTFAGFVEQAGTTAGSLTVNAGFGDQQDGFVLGGGTGGLGDLVFAAGASINPGAFQGIAQFSQIPGSNVALQQALIVNLAVIQARASDLGALRAQLSPLFGL